jgi:hypothetical protein
MSITRLNPNTIFLGGERIQVNDLACSEVVTPGQIVERFNNGGIIRWRKNTIVTGNLPCAVACEHSMANKGVDDTYAANDLVEVSIVQPGGSFWGYIASGQNIVAGNQLQTVSGGTLAIYSSGSLVATALENKANVNVLTRIRCEAV